jgi:hypothetical protein
MLVQLGCACHIAAPVACGKRKLIWLTLALLTTQLLLRVR